MESIYNIFNNLKKRDNSINNGYFVTSLPFNSSHKLGCSIEGFPMFFVKCIGSGQTVDINLEIINILFQRECDLIVDNAPSESNKYSLITLKSNSIDIQKYFIDITCMILDQLPKAPSINELRVEITKLIDLFSSISKLPKKTVQGLWAELCLIFQSKNPSYLIRSWHLTPEDKFDFNDSIDKIEVKCTSILRRVHKFSYEQLKPNKNSNLIIASFYVIESGNGHSVFDLVEMIQTRVKDFTLQVKLKEIVIRSLGSKTDGASEYHFDLKLAKDSLALYDYSDIPTISGENIPNQVSEVHFTCDLTGIKTIIDNGKNYPNSTLINSIII